MTFSATKCNLATIFICTALMSSNALCVTAHADDLTGATPPTGAVWLDGLDLSNVTQGYGLPEAGKSVDGGAIVLGGVTYKHGLGTHAIGDVDINLHGTATRFTSEVGVDDAVKPNGSVTFTVIVDGVVKAHTGVLHGGDPAQLIDIDLTGAKKLRLEVGDGDDGNTYDHADWAGAVIVVAPGGVAPVTVGVIVIPPRLVIPTPDPLPAIHGPQVVGTTPGRPFLFMIPATGDGSLSYTATNLPPGLTLDSATGIITGSVSKAGETVAMITVTSAMGKASRRLTIVAGYHKLAMTPPMGWNSWNVWGTQVDEGKVKAAADELVSTGLARHGFGYVNIDDAWEADRDTSGAIRTNSKFPDMTALGQYIHNKGLRFGIYSSPGPKTCGGYTASYQHEDQDAQSYAAWGVDYLKYDWCSYATIAGGDYSLLANKKPYLVMRTSLDKVNRDILFSYCQYGMANVWEWGAKAGGNTWRTTGDINDTWRNLHNIYESQPGHEEFAGPGHWNDPDMLEVGMVGFGNPHASHLTPNEQILHVSLWSLLAAPLLIGCDLTRLDPFTLALLSNDEILDIDQDPLGKAASQVVKNGEQEVWSRPLSDGTTAVGLVNGGDEPATITANWSDIGVAGSQPVRDLWLHKNVGTFNGSYAVEVPVHGCVVVKVGKAQ